MTQERITAILEHIRTAANLAEEEAKELQEIQPMVVAFRKAARLDSTSSSMREVSGAFNILTSSLLAAGMPLSPGNEIQLRISNAINEALHKALQ